MVVFYVVNVILSLLLGMFAFAHTGLFKRVTRSLSRKQVCYVSTVVGEFPQAILFVKLVLLGDAVRQGVFQHAVMNYVYWVDVSVCLLFWKLFLQSYFARYHIYNCIKFYRDASSTEPPSLFTVSFWFRLANPMWSVPDRSITAIRNVCYATESELNCSKNRLSLDVYHHACFPKHRPVLLFVHGGSYMHGSKNDKTHFVDYLVLKKYIVVQMNYRLSADAAYPAQLTDVKRAIRWIKQNIATYGGDPSFIALCGVSSGAHLATMAALTCDEQEQFQPGFEDIDTSVQLVIAISGIFDLTNFQNRFGFDLKSWFMREVSGDQNDAFFKQSSPTRRLKDVATRMHLATATPEEKKGIALPHFLIMHGNSDSLAPISHVREFVKEFQVVTKAKMVYAELPDANHFFYALSTPRAHYIAYGIEPFLRSLFDEHCKKLKKE